MVTAFGVDRCVRVTNGQRYARTGANERQIDGSSADDYRRLLSELSAEGKTVRVVAHLWTYGTDTGPAESAEASALRYEHGLFSLLFLVQALADSATRLAATLFTLMISDASQALRRTSGSRWKKRPCAAWCARCPKRRRGYAAATWTCPRTVQIETPH